MGTGQYTISDKHQKYILAMLEEMGLDTCPVVQEYDEETGKSIPPHRDVKIHICSYDDETENHHMYVQVD